MLSSCCPLSDCRSSWQCFQLLLAPGCHAAEGTNKEQQLVDIRVCFVAAGVFSKATTDGNAAALDKALEALQAYLEKAPDTAAARFAGSVSSNIVKKTCGARPSTAAKGIDCLLGLVELEQAEKVLVSGWRTTPIHTMTCSHSQSADPQSTRSPLQKSSASSTCSVGACSWSSTTCHDNGSCGVLQGALIEGYTNKVPKVVVGALDGTLLILRCAYQLSQQHEIWQD